VQSLIVDQRFYETLARVGVSFRLGMLPRHG